MDNWRPPRKAHRKPMPPRPKSTRKRKASAKAASPTPEPAAKRPKCHMTAEEFEDKLNTWEEATPDFDASYEIKGHSRPTISTRRNKYNTVEKMSTNQDYLQSWSIAAVWSNKYYQVNSPRSIKKNSIVDFPQ
jgi:hypothetical protein